MKKRELKAAIRRLEWKLEEHATAAQEADERAARWEKAWYEGDAIRTKLQARIDELVGERREAHARAPEAEQELAAARRTLGTVGWLHDELTRVIPHWRRAFAQDVGAAWENGETTAPQQLRWALDYLRRRSA